MSSTNFESSHAPSIGTFGWMAATDTEPLSSVDGLSDSPYNTDTTAITPAAVSTTMPRLRSRYTSENTSAVLAATMIALTRYTPPSRATWITAGWNACE